MSKQKALLFKVFAGLLPVLVLVILELGLRIGNYGQDLRLFVYDRQAPGYLMVNPHLSKRYFNVAANAPIGNADHFLEKKAVGAIRFFVLGESTTIGFPYMHNGAFPRFLQYRLMRMYPDRQIEIINLSLTAVNSFTVRDIAEELPKYQPDAVLIYCGHNEYYGALGVGSTNSFGNNGTFVRALIQLRKLRVVQLITDAYELWFKPREAKDIDTSKNLMERMVQSQKISIGSDMYNAGIAQFKSNMEAVCELLSAQHVPVLLSTVVSNEKDLPPFISDSVSNANSTFTKAKLAYNAGNYPKAKDLFLAAKDADLLRFRAPERINKEIMALTRKYPGVYIVDSKKVFESSSPHGIIGTNLLTEHVHPNLIGYGLMSEAFFKILEDSRLLPVHPVENLTLDQLRHEMPITAVDSAFGDYTICLLKMRWPFNQKITMPQPVTVEDSAAYAIAGGKLKWNDAMDKLISLYQTRKDTVGMLKVAEAVMLEYPTDATFYQMAGKLSAALQQNGKARNYLKRAFRLRPSMQLAQDIFKLEIKRRDPRSALVLIEYGLSQTPQSPNLQNVQRLLEHMIDVESSIRLKPTSAGFDELARCYHLLGEDRIAHDYASHKAI